MFRLLGIKSISPDGNKEPWTHYVTAKILDEFALYSNKRRAPINNYVIKYKNKSDMSYLQGMLRTSQSFTEWIYIKSAVAGVISFIAYSIGYDLEVVKVLAYMLVIDWFLGSILAIKRKKFVSWGMIRTCYKFLLYVAILVAVHQAQNNMFFPGWTDDFFEFLIIITELKSILENAALLGFKPAHKLDQLLNSFVEEKFKKLI